MKNMDFWQEMYWKGNSINAISYTPFPPSQLSTKRIKTPKGRGIYKYRDIYQQIFYSAFYITKKILKVNTKEWKVFYWLECVCMSVCPCNKVFWHSTMWVLPSRQENIEQKEERREALKKEKNGRGKPVRKGVWDGVNDEP